MRGPALARVLQMMVEPSSILDRFRGALVGCLLGDAFGSVLEGVSVEDSRLEEQVTRRSTERRPWRYTDDTEMALGLARSLVECGRLDEAHLLDTWSTNYEPARGYGRGMKLAIRAWRSGSNPAESAWRDGSNGTGAAVRVVALACVFHDSEPELEAAARESAALTHGGEAGIEGCVLHAIAVSRALRWPRGASVEPAAFLAGLKNPGVLGSKLRLIPALLALPPRDVVAELGNGVTADEGVPLGIFAFLRSMPSFEEVVVTAARCGGDVDTIAAMAGTLAGALVGHSGLPALWLENAEGVSEATQLADELHALWLTRRGR